MVVAPTDVAVLDTVAHESTLTLTTCNPRYSAATRMVVVAKFDGRSQGALPTTPRSPAGSATGLRALPGDSLSGGSNGWWPAVLWGTLALVIIVGSVFLWRAGPRPLRWGVVIVGFVGFFLALFVCFEQISLALPPGF